MTCVVGIGCCCCCRCGVRVGRRFTSCDTDFWEEMEDMNTRRKKDGGNEVGENSK